MNRKILYSSLTLIGIASIALTWSLKARHLKSESPLATGEAIVSKQERRSTSPLQTGSDSLAQTSSITRDANSKNPKEQRLALEKAIVAQEKILEETRASLALFVRSNGIIYNPDESQEKKTVGEQPSTPDNEVGGYVDLKKEYELQIQNLERMKLRLDKL